MKKMLGKKK